jgi:hypothetical protein
MTDVTREEHLVRRLARKVVLAVSQVAVAERRIDVDLVLLVGHIIKLFVRKAKPPGLVIVAGPIGDPVGTVGESEQVLLEFSERELALERYAVPDEVEVRPVKVDDGFSAWIFDERAFDVPFLGDGPVKYGGTRGDFMGLQGDIFPQNAQGLSHPFAGYAAANRVQPTDEVGDFFAHSGEVDQRSRTCWSHA